jgi:UDP-N-acetylglucosamine 2-epimerase (non-hydrolysing)
VLTELSAEVPVLFPIHPRTRKQIERLAMPRATENLHLIDPLGYMEFLALQSKAALVIADSGGIQEETTYLGIPCLTVRENTERPVTVSIGTNILVGQDSNRLRHEAQRILRGGAGKGTIPPLWDGKASERIAEVLAASCGT